MDPEPKQWKLLDILVHFHSSSATVHLHIAGTKACELKNIRQNGWNIYLNFTKGFPYTFI